MSDSLTPGCIHAHIHINTQENCHWVASKSLNWVMLPVSQIPHTYTPDISLTHIHTRAYLTVHISHWGRDSITAKVKEAINVTQIQWGSLSSDAVNHRAGWVGIHCHFAHPLVKCPEWSGWCWLDLGSAECWGAMHCHATLPKMMWL